MDACVRRYWAGVGPAILPVQVEESLGSDTFKLQILADFLLTSECYDEAISMYLRVLCAYLQSSFDNVLVEIPLIGLARSCTTSDSFRIAIDLTKRALAADVIKFHFAATYSKMMAMSGELSRQADDIEGAISQLQQAHCHYQQLETIWEDRRPVTCLVLEYVRRLPHSRPDVQALHARIVRDHAASFECLAAHSNNSTIKELLSEWADTLDNEGLRDFTGSSMNKTLWSSPTNLTGLRRLEKSILTAYLWAQWKRRCLSLIRHITMDMEIEVKDIISTTALMICTSGNFTATLPLVNLREKSFIDRMRKNARKMLAQSPAGIGRAFLKVYVSLDVPLTNTVRDDEMVTTWFGSNVDYARYRCQPRIFSPSVAYAIFDYLAESRLLLNNFEAPTEGNEDQDLLMPLEPSDVTNQQRTVVQHDQARHSCPEIFMCPTTRSSPASSLSGINEMRSIDRRVKENGRSTTPVSSSSMPSAPLKRALESSENILLGILEHFPISGNAHPSDMDWEPI